MNVVLGSWENQTLSRGHRCRLMGCVSSKGLKSRVFIVRYPEIIIRGGFGNPELAVDLV